MARRVRRLLIAALLIITLYHFFPSNDAIPSILQHNRGAPNGATAELAKYMNNPKRIPHITFNASSFAWNSIRFAHQPPLTPKLPPPVTKRPRIQHHFTSDSPTRAATIEFRRQEVLRVFKKAWASYREKAWMKDALKPLSGGYVDQFSGWAATLVDSLDTLWIMGLREEFYEAVAAVATIDFGKSTSDRVNTFETCIRYLGGLLAAYDLSEHPVLKAKATEVGDLLYAAFNTENAMPVDFINFELAKKGEGLAVEPSVVSASPGTITLEFSRLSQITGDNKYYAAVSNLMDVFYEHQNDTKLPGMWPMVVRMAQKDVVTGYQFLIAGNADSLYEYLPKAHALLGSADASSKKFDIMARTFLQTAKNNLFFRPMTPTNEDILISGNLDVLEEGSRLDPESEHLACFIGGLYGLSGRLFDSDDYLDTGAKLTRGCIYAYKAFESGIMPERFNMVKCPGPDPKIACKWDEELWLAERDRRPEYHAGLPKGFTTAKDPRYILRPEAIESVFILWRITGKEEYREAAWKMFTSVIMNTETEYANAAVEDVSEAGSEKTDYMESFWLAETLKYFYMCFAHPELISLDEFVLNTEAHPFRLSEVL